LLNLRIVLVETTHPGNIGAAARAMKNMGLHRLVLVRPLLFPHAEATARAAGADDVLAHAQVVDSLEAALTGCRVVLGVSARRRGIAGPELDPRECAARVAAFGTSTDIALVFGRESSGLNNDEMDHCHFLVCIPTHPAFSSLNLAAAVLIIAYELRMACLAGAVPPVDKPRRLPATAEAMTHFYEHLEQILLATGFLNPANPRRVMRRLRRLFNRAQPDQNEVNILRGILTSVQKLKRTSSPRSSPLPQSGGGETDQTNS
jgi:tRNA (cytidine32/uridine32-2'-O)-methyltransferase